MEINGTSRTIGLIGDPVEHTLSPVIHNGISKAMGISSVYVPFNVKNDGLETAIKGAYELNILGMNVTVPHKNSVMKYLTAIDEGAERIGAVNTLVRCDHDKGYKGYNTDMTGLLRQVHDDGIFLENSSVVVLGAGGAARAVVYMCINERAEKIYVLNRTYAKADSIAGDMNRYAASNTVIPMKLSDYDKINDNGLVVFQATSIGLSPNVDNVVIDDERFYEKVNVGIDLIYNPANTKFMQLVTEHGGRAYNALKMLLYQGVTAYELWHDIKVPVDVIEDIYIELKRKVYPKDNIVLIGFMGSGKSTVGRLLADRLSMNYIDADSYIEDKEGMTISEIFEKKGEEEFRRIETEVLKRFLEDMSGTVLSTGGGMPLRKENAGLLKQIGRVYYLDAANQIIYDRVKNDSSRPLLQGEDSYGRICSLMKERKPIYEKASDHVIDANSDDPNEILQKMEESITCFSKGV